MLRFTLRRDPYRRLSACADGPSGRDVDCRVHVRVRLMPAGHAPEHRLALAVLRCAVPADAAGLRRVRRIDFLDPSRCLVLQPLDQPPQPLARMPRFRPALARRRFGRYPPVVQGRVWASGAWSSGDPQVLHPDHVEPAREVGAGLLHPVLAPVTGPGIQLRDRGLHPPRRFEPRRHRARRRCSCFSRSCSVRQTGAAGVHRWTTPPTP